MGFGISIPSWCVAGLFPSRRFIIRFAVVALVGGFPVVILRVLFPSFISLLLALFCEFVSHTLGLSVDGCCHRFAVFGLKPA